MTEQTHPLLADHEVRARAVSGGSPIVQRRDQVRAADAENTAADEFDDWLDVHDDAVRAGIVAEIDVQLHQETVLDDPYARWPGAPRSEEQQHYGQGFIAGRIDAFSRFRNIYAQHVSTVAVNDAAQAIIDAANTPAPPLPTPRHWATLVVDDIVIGSGYCWCAEPDGDHHSIGFLPKPGADR